MKNKEEILDMINKNKDWTSWKCRCGCLNGRGNGDCGRCGGLSNDSCMFYGSETIHGGIWKPEISIEQQTKA